MGMSESKLVVFVGIDVSKGTLDVRIEPPGEVFQVANDDEGIKALCLRIGKQPVHGQRKRDAMQSGD
jgi:hypothetical protein